MALCKKGGFGVPRCSAAVAAAAASSSAFPEASLAAAAGRFLKSRKGRSLLCGVHHGSAVAGSSRSGVINRDSPPRHRRVAVSKRLLGSFSREHVLYGGKHIFGVKPRYFHSCVSNASSSLSAATNPISSKKREEGEVYKETSSRACSPSSSLSTTSSECSHVSSAVSSSESSSSGGISSSRNRNSDSSRRACSSRSTSSGSRTSIKSSSSSSSGSSSQRLVLHFLSPGGNAAGLYGKGNGGLQQQQQHLLYNSFTGGRRSLICQQQQLRGFAFPSLRFFANSGGLSSSSSPSSENPAGRPNASGYSDSNVSLQQLRVLQQQAEANLEDSQLQQRYLAALNAHGESYRAVQHVEKHKDNFPGMSEAVLVEYVKALCSSGLIHQQGRSLSQVLQRYVGEGTEGGANEGNFKGGEGAGGRDLSSSSSLSSLLQQHQTQQQQLMQQQLMVQLQQLVHQLQVEGAQRTRTGDAAARTAGAAAAAAASEAEMLKPANVGTAGAAGRFAAASAAAPLTGWRRYSPLRAIKWFCRGLWGLLKACNRGLWGLLLSPVIAVFLFWSFLNDGVHAVQNSVKNMEGSGGMGNQSGGKKANDWVAGKVVKPEEVNTTFADVKGCEEVKKEVVEVVEYLKAPAKFTAMGARLPKGVLLQGPPGTGKTLLARAIAGEAGVPFIHASGSDFEEMYVGVGASRLRQLFAEARKRSPCILFIDEIDALGGRRTLTENKHHRQTLNQLLTELDGFKPSDGVTLICATNLAEALDPALTRPGRIDRIIHVPLPCKKERIDILQHYAVKMPLAEDVDLDLLASLTSGMTGADLANLLNFAAIRAATEGKSQVTLAEVEESFDRLMVGNRRSSVVMKEEERKVTAYHESGHALMCLYTPGSLPLHKATILFRGSALGVTWSVNREESFSKSQKEYLASLDVAMGGKAAEEIVFGKGNVTSGCFNDLQKATRVARNMVTGFGMGVEDSRAPMVVSGKEYSFLSDESKKKVDEAVQRLLDQSYERARVLLTEKRDELERLAQALLEHETLTADEIRAAVAGTIDSAAIKERRRQQKTAGAQTLKPKPKPKKKSGGNEGEGEEEQQPPSALLRSAGGRPPSASAATKRGEDEQQQQRSALLHDSSCKGKSSLPASLSAAPSRGQEDTGRSQERAVISPAAAENEGEDKPNGAVALSSSVQPTSNDGTQKVTERLVEKVPDFSAAGGTLGDSKAVVRGGDSRAVVYGGDSKTAACEGDSKTVVCDGDSKAVCGGELTGSGGAGSEGTSFAAAGSSHPYSVAATTPTVSAVSALLAAAVHESPAEHQREKQQRPQRTSEAGELSVAESRTEKTETRDEKTGTIDGKESYTKELSGGKAAHVDEVSAVTQCDKAGVESKLPAHEDEDITKHSKRPSAHARKSATSEGKKQAENSGRDQGRSGGRV